MKFLNQTGRTMTEMLGVLALIGILSIIALVGYSYGMIKLQSNSLVNELNMRALLIAAQVEKNPDNLSFQEMGDTTKYGNKVTASLDDMNNQYFFITVEKVPVRVCRQILTMGWSDPVEIYVNELQVDDSDSLCGSEGEEPTMDFKFDSVGIGNTQNDLSPEETVTPNEGCTSQKPLLSSSGDCYPCDYEGAIHVGGRIQSCDACSNRYFRNSFCAVKECPFGKPLQDYGGNCYACDESLSVYVDNESDCAVCSNRIMEDRQCNLKSCPNDKPFKIDGNCESCGFQGLIDVTQDESVCLKCTNRKVVTDNWDSSPRKYCRMICPSDSPLEEAYGGCFKCDYPGDILMYYDSDSCSKCDERHIVNSHCVLK